MKSVGILLFSALSFIPTVVQSATILWVDLTTTNQITITATAGASSATVNGSDFTGFYLDQIFGGSGNLSSALVSGDLTSANNTADNTPLLWRSGSFDPGLNVYSFANGPNASFTSGSQAFTGSATWNLSPGSYADLLAGNTTGSIYFAADDSGDLGGATIVGEWALGPPPEPVSLPSSAILLGTSILGIGLHRRRKKLNSQS